MTDSLSNLLDISRLQSILDDFHAVAGISSTVADADGTILTRSGWPDVCAKFHRLHPQAKERCIANNARLSASTGAAGSPSPTDAPTG